MQMYVCRLSVCAFITDSITLAATYSCHCLFDELLLLQPLKNGHSKVLALYTDVRLRRFLIS